MQFSNTTTNDGLIQDCESILFGDDYGVISNNAPMMDTFTRLLNRAYYKVASLIMAHDNRWQWDDTNHTTKPIGTTELTSGRSDYKLDISHLRILKVFVKDNSGNLQQIKPIDIHDPEGYTIYQSPVEGLPVLYDKYADIIRLYPTPNYTQDEGLEVHFQRPPSYFTKTDTVKEAGIPIIFHHYLSNLASFYYAVQKQLTIKNDLHLIVKDMEEDIKIWYQQRSKDEQLTLRAKIRSSK